MKATAGVAILALVLVGCAHRSPDQLGPLQPVIDPYSRNGIVCIPTGLGNVIGGVPGQLALAPFALVDMEVHRTTERIASYLMAVLSIAPALVVGGAMGTPFLPFSYLADEEPCHWI
ncbi:MAG TPA: hypothetical protein VNE71_17195 [Myxococcota bacterium]|nr:hypothetical protein [Myxococcota bacterium]